MYQGPATLCSIGRHTHIPHVQLHRSAALREHDGASVVREWYGHFRLMGLSPGLMDILGTEARIRLPDGRDGVCLVTAANTEDSVWIIEIQGVGTPPWEK